MIDNISSDALSKRIQTAIHFDISRHMSPLLRVRVPVFAIVWRHHSHFTVHLSNQMICTKMLIFFLFTNAFHKFMQ